MKRMRFAELAVHLLIALACKDKRKIDVIFNGECIKKVEILKNEAEIVTAEGCNGGFLDS